VTEWLRSNPCAPSPLFTPCALWGPQNGKEGDLALAVLGRYVEINSTHLIGFLVHYRYCVKLVYLWSVWESVGSTPRQR